MEHICWKLFENIYETVESLNFYNISINIHHPRCQILKCHKILDFFSLNINQFFKLNVRRCLVGNFRWGYLRNWLTVARHWAQAGASCAQLARRFGWHRPYLLETIEMTGTVQWLSTWKFWEKIQNVFDLYMQLVRLNPTVWRRKHLECFCQNFQIEKWRNCPVISLGSSRVNSFHHGASGLYLTSTNIVHLT